jgi:hypothetical protein
MGKIILEFDSVEENAEANNALRGSDWKSVVWEMDQYLRNKIKYCEDNEDPAAFQVVRDELHELLNNLNLNLE